MNQMCRYLFGFVVLLSWGACGDGSNDGADVLPGDPAFVRSPALNVESTSQANGTRSHNIGQNCMRCHQPHGPGLGLFTAAGTLRNPDGSPHPNGALILTRDDPAKDPNGPNVVATITADALGNFFTTQALPLPNEGLFALVRSADGTTQNWMGWTTITASCNSCHVGSNVLSVKKRN